MPATPFIKRQVVRAGRKYNVSPRVLMGLIEQESGFNAGAVSSAGARGLTQFIPSTAQAYGVKYGTSKKAQKTQIHGAAKYLNDLGFSKNKAYALGRYYGSTSAPYASEVLAKSKKYKGIAGQVGAGKGKGATTKGKSKLLQAGTNKKTATIPGVSYKKERQAAALDLIRTEDKTWQDYAGFSATMESLKDVPSRSVQIPGSKAVRQPGQKTGQQRGTGKGGGQLYTKTKGDWAGTQRVTDRLTKGLGPVTSTKRSTQTTSSGNISDHWVGNKTAYAKDIGATGSAGDKIVKRLAKRLGVKPGRLVGTYDPIVKGKYRIQVLWKVSGHYDHVHVGVARV